MAKFKKKYLKSFKNFYIIGLIAFAVWMLFFDTHSWLLHNDLNEDKEALNKEKQYYINEMKKDEKATKELSTDKGVEKVARETYYMKKPNEEIYIIEYEDSIPKSKKDE
ncbi:septum formation initiator [Winogradskyella sp. PC-19]|uniref:FtsB family cell division protein n=1 Tax=unclassified Winogradskyella TaxID=2615021 RepID=UPI000B3BDFF6|nr:MULTISPECIES: septum formation initiator family protein [unclassified Winogradskyella]ARV10540.1 septum formation initiator [Winogradskyella sp. PC-19]RZN82273.1 MAG: septum formation initiator [Winogradskyella sp.]